MLTQGAPDTIEATGSEVKMLTILLIALLVLLLTGGGVGYRRRGRRVP